MERKQILQELDTTIEQMDLEHIGQLPSPLLRRLKTPFCLLHVSKNCTRRS